MLAAMSLSNAEKQVSCNSLNDVPGIRLKTKRPPDKPEAFLIGAGEEIRTLDPNLGKVVLYP